MLDKTFNINKIRRSPMGNIPPDGVQEKGVSNIRPRILSRQNPTFLSAADVCLSFCIPLPSQSNSHPKRLLDPEDEGITIFQDASTSVPDYTASLREFPEG